jgi:putative flippase GtrA
MANISSLSSKILRFIATGLLNTVFGFGLYALLLWVGLVPHVAQLIGRMAGATFNYFSYGKLVFQDQNLIKSRFIGNYIANYLVAAALLWFLLLLGLNAYLAGALTMVVATLLNFIVLRFFVAEEEPSIRKSLSDYRPHARDWRWMPDWALLIKDTIHDLYHLALDRLVQFNFIGMVWRHLFGRNLKVKIEKAGCLLIHIPKTGGTSISKSLYGRNLPHYSAMSWHLRFRNDFSKWCRFAVIRHPVARFLSAWHFTKNGGSDIILNSRYEMALLSPMEPLEAFIRRVSQSPSILRSVPAFRPQVDFVIGGNGEFLLDRLFMIDGDNSGSNALTDWLSIPSLPHLNKSQSSRVELTDDLQEALLELYKEDLDLYNRISAAGGVLKLSTRCPNRN